MEIQELDWFYVENLPNKGIVRLSKEESRHLKVKRHFNDEKICLFDGKGKVAVCKIIGKEEVSIDHLHEFENDAILTIATAIPKGDRLDFMLQKLTELNVAKIILMKTKYSVVEPKDSKQDRLKRILIEACKQCKRAWLPELSKITNFADVLKDKSNYDNKIILEQGNTKLNADNSKSTSGTLVLIGPEGGFTEEELSQAEKSGFTKASISKNTLRIETAAIAVCAILNNQ